MTDDELDLMLDRVEHSRLFGPSTPRAEQYHDDVTALVAEVKRLRLRDEANGLEIRHLRAVDIAARKELERFAALLAAKEDTSRE